MPTGPTGPVRAALVWLDSTLRSTTALAFSEIAGPSLRITPVPTGTHIEFGLSGQWEHNTASAYMAIQIYDLTSGLYIPGIYWVTRAVGAGQNVSFTFTSVVLASAIVSGRTFVPYWSTGSGQCSARNDTTPMNFTAKEYV
jgi:hypothetical protein